MSSLTRERAVDGGLQTRRSRADPGAALDAMPSGGEVSSLPSIHDREGQRIAAFIIFPAVGLNCQMQCDSHLVSVESGGFRVAVRPRHPVAWREVAPGAGNMREESGMRVRGVIFDLDGTVVDSRLDFAAIRRDVGVPAGEPILEWIETLPPGEARDRAVEILHRHEHRGAEAATLMPGIMEFLASLVQAGIHRAVFTRNSRPTTEHTLRRLGLDAFAPVITREDAPPKPDPTGLETICRHWRLQPDDVLFIGDYLYDLEAGRNAGIRTVLYAPQQAFDHDHDPALIFDDFGEIWNLICADGTG